MNLRFLSLLLLASSSAASASNEDAAANNNNHNNNLRQRKIEVAQEEITVKEGRIRIILHCNEEAEYTHDDCYARIKEFSHEQLNIIHKLKESKAWAVSVGDSDEDTMKQLEEGNYFDIVSDPIRKPMYIKESIQVEDENSNRKLQFWNRQDVPYGIDMVKAQEVWETYGVRGEGVRVCVMDTGILRGHEDFVSGNLSGYSGREAFTPWDADSNGHGTHVSGTIAAADNDEGVVGVAPGAQIYTVRVFDNDGNFYGSDVVAGAEACRDAGAKIISMSLGGPSYDGDEKRIFDTLYDQGILAIAAAGNDGDDDYNFPASYTRVMSVAAVNSNRNHASFSQFNDRVDIAAPGVNVRSTWNNGRYSSISGTSMATPHVSGVAALMLAYKPDATPTQLFDAMINTAENPNTSGRDNKYGHGIINAMAAIQSLSGNGGGGDQQDDEDETSCTADEIDFSLKIRTDDYGYETSWQLVNVQNDQTVLSQAEGTYGNNDNVATQQCLNANNCYTLTIFDSYGDGICCGQGSPGFQVEVDGQVFQGSQDFTSFISIPGIGNCSNNSGPTNPPNPNPTNPPVNAPTFSPVPPPTPAPVPSPTSPPTSDECCFLFFCWSC